MIETKASARACDAQWGPRQNKLWGNRHSSLGLYESHNAQRGESLALQVVLVGAPTNERE